MLTAGDLRLNVDNRQVQNERGEIVRLTSKEARLLAVLMQYPGLTLSRGFLMREVWEISYVGDTRTLEVHVSWLRRKIGAAHIKAIRGTAYRFEAESSTDATLP